MASCLFSFTSEATHFSLITLKRRVHVGRAKERERKRRMKRNYNKELKQKERDIICVQMRNRKSCRLKDEKRNTIGVR